MSGVACVSFADKTALDQMTNETQNRVETYLVVQAQASIYDLPSPLCKLPGTAEVVRRLAFPGVEVE